MGNGKPFNSFFLLEFKTEIYLTRLRAIEHSSASIITHDVDWGGGGGGGGIGMRDRSVQEIL